MYLLLLLLLLGAVRGRPALSVVMSLCVCENAVGVWLGVAERPPHADPRAVPEAPERQRWAHVQIHTL